MPRLSRTVVAARETLALDLFRQGKTVDEVQLALAQGWNGHKMNIPRLNKLKRSVTPATVDAVVESKPITTGTTVNDSDTVVDVAVTPVANDVDSADSSDDAPVFSDAANSLPAGDKQQMVEFV